MDRESSCGIKTSDWKSTTQSCAVVGTPHSEATTGYQTLLLAVSIAEICGLEHPQKTVVHFFGDYNPANATFVKGHSARMGATARMISLRLGIFRDTIKSKILTVTHTHTHLPKKTKQT